MKLLAGVLCVSASLLCAQGPRQRPDFAGGGGRRGPASQLGLTSEQQNKIYTAQSDARVQTKGMRDQLNGLEDQIDAAIKAGDEGKIDTLSADISRLQGQMMAIQSKAESRIYQSLTAEQRAKADQLPGGVNRLLRGGGPGRPPGPPPPPRQ